MKRHTTISIFFVAGIIALAYGSINCLNLITASYPSVYPLIAVWLIVMWSALVGSGIYWGWRWVKGTYPPDMKKFIEEELLKDD